MFYMTPWHSAHCRNHCLKLWVSRCSKAQLNVAVPSVGGVGASSIHVRLVISPQENVWSCEVRGMWWLRNGQIKRPPCAPLCRMWKCLVSGEWSAEALVSSDLGIEGSTQSRWCRAQLSLHYEDARCIVAWIVFLKISNSLPGSCILNFPFPLNFQFHYSLKWAGKEALGPTIFFLFSGYRKVKWPGSEADHPPPSSAEVKNMWSYTSPPHMSSWCGA
jgi:hypothetical protein